MMWWGEKCWGYHKTWLMNGSDGWGNKEVIEVEVLLFLFGLSSSPIS